MRRYAKPGLISPRRRRNWPDPVRLAQKHTLYAGLESIKLGRGGDALLADFLALDAHTVARGRQQLLDHEVAPGGRTRRQGGGRLATEKKRPK